MRKLLVAAALFALAAPDRIHAQPAPASEPAPGVETVPPQRDARDEERRQHDHEHGPPRPRLFISPSGEPFRGGDGLAAWFHQADTDHDGAITQAEFQTDALRVFKLYDTNGDGVIDGFEIQAYEHDRVPEISEILVPGEEGGPRGGGFGSGGGGHGRRQRGTGGDGQGGGGQSGSGQAGAQAAPRTPAAGREGAARFSLLNEPEPLLAADEDVDGKVTLAEWNHATARRFAKLDKTHSGRLTLDELRPGQPKR